MYLSVTTNGILTDFSILKKRKEKEFFKKCLVKNQNTWGLITFLRGWKNPL